MSAVNYSGIRITIGFEASSPRETLTGRSSLLTPSESPDGSIRLPVRPSNSCFQLCVTLQSRWRRRRRLGR